MLIKISNLEVKYGSKFVLKNMNLSLNAGEIVTIVGPNGSGKTTLFKAIIGTVPLSKGTIEINPKLRIGYVPQQLKIDQTLPSLRDNGAVSRFNDFNPYNSAPRKSQEKIRNEMAMRKSKSPVVFKTNVNTFQPTGSPILTRRVGNLYGY